MKIPKQKILSASRCLINIGLTLQFYVPCAVCLYYIGLMTYMLFTIPPDKMEGSGGMIFIPIGFVALGIMIFLVILTITIIWCAIYLFWDRYGNRFHALCFLIATNVLLGGLWSLMWIVKFAAVPIWWHDPEFWLLSPAPIVIPTLLYIIASRLFFPKNGTGVSEPQS